MVTLVYFLLPKKLCKAWLLIGSYAFYMNWNAVYGLLLLAVTLTTYVGGLLIERSASDAVGKPKKAPLIVSLVIVIGLLFYFKYANFFLENIAHVIPAASSPRFDFIRNILLPVGISFYVFQAVGYVIDVYRGNTKAEHNFINFALFVSFFPQLVAGPIERSTNLLPQIRSIDENRHFDAGRFFDGLVLMLWGLFVKMVIADRAALFVNEVFEHYYFYGFAELSVGALLFFIQLYCDFAGYSMVAIGAAKVLGFTLMDNFNAPYFSMTIAEHWRRWHISFSKWMMDYVYIPLGGNRKGLPRKCINLFIVFLLSGLWHGAGWTYIIWGCLHGIFVVIDNLLKKPIDGLKTRFNLNTEAFSYKLLFILKTNLVLAFIDIIFRADSIRHALYYMQQMFRNYNPWVFFDQTIYEIGMNPLNWHILIIACEVLFIVEFMYYRTGKKPDALLQGQGVWFKFAVVFALFTAVWVFGIYGPYFNGSEFIYFQF